jgi:hypothetical protein
MIAFWQSQNFLSAAYHLRAQLARSIYFFCFAKAFYFFRAVAFQK